MQPRTCLLFALILSTAIFFGIAALAADLPKEGTFSGQYSASGVVKANPIGKEQLLLTYDEHGVSVGEGLFNHFTWHCWGMGDYTSGQGQDHGYCLGTDPAGDQIAVNWEVGRHAMDEKTPKGSFTLTTGTGKYAGITGSATFLVDGGDLRSGTEGISFSHNTHKGSYKLP